MPLRIGFDMDGVLADFAGAYHAVEERIFGPAASATRAGDPEDETGDDEQRVDADDPSKEPKTAATEALAETKEPSAETTEKPDAATDSAEPESVNRMPEPDPKKAARHAKEMRRRRDVVWSAIHATPDFWATLKPTEEGAVKRVHELMLRHRWEVFFITQRPGTEGDTVQRQTQKWLVDQGFEWPSVLVIAGSRGAAAGALKLDFHVDDSPKNCIDVKSESRARPLLIIDPADARASASARRLGIGTAPTIGAALDILEQASGVVKTEPTLFGKLAKLVGWH